MVPVAVNCCVVPRTMLGEVGVTEINERVAAVTVSVVVPVTLPDIADIVDVPAATEVANPFEPDVLLMVATDVRADDHVTEEVRF